MDSELIEQIWDYIAAYSPALIFLGIAMLWANYLAGYRRAFGRDIENHPKKKSGL